MIKAISIVLLIMAISPALGCDRVHSPYEDYNELDTSDITAAEQRMWDTRDHLVTISNVRALMQRFVSIEEPVDWWPSVLFIFARMTDDGHFYGDCQTAAVMGQWALEVIGVPSAIWIMSGDKVPYDHVITVANDGSCFISNDDLYGVQSGDWRDAALALKPEDYDTIRKR